MNKTTFLTIFPSFENLETVKKTLPSVIEETKNNDAQLIVHDSSVKEKEKKWKYLRKLNEKNNFFLILSDNLSSAHARNMLLGLGLELYTPDYVCILEDDHGFKPGTISSLVKAMDKYYGQTSPNGLKYGMFSTCTTHTNAKLKNVPHSKHKYPAIKNKKENPFRIAGSNNCFRCAPTHHWLTVLGKYETDEYLLSEFQTSQPRWRNYHKGFTVMYVGGGKLKYLIETEGRGMSNNSNKKLWDNKFTASDPRSNYLKK